MSNYYNTERPSHFTMSNSQNNSGGQSRYNVHWENQRPHSPNIPIPAPPLPRILPPPRPNIEMDFHRFSAPSSMVSLQPGPRHTPQHSGNASSMPFVNSDSQAHTFNTATQRESFEVNSTFPSNQYPHGSNTLQGMNLNIQPPMIPFEALHNKIKQEQNIMSGKMPDPSNTVSSVSQMFRPYAQIAGSGSFLRPNRSQHMNIPPPMLPPMILPNDFQRPRTLSPAYPIYQNVPAVGSTVVPDVHILEKGQDAVEAWLNSRKHEQRESPNLLKVKYPGCLIILCENKEFYFILELWV